MDAVKPMLLIAALAGALALVACGESDDDTSADNACNACGADGGSTDGGASDGGAA